MKFAQTCKHAWKDACNFRSDTINHVTSADFYCQSCKYKTTVTLSNIDILAGKRAVDVLYPKVDEMEYVEWI